MTKVDKAIKLAKKKGLRVQRNVFSLGYCITTPSGLIIRANNETELFNWINGY